MSVTTPITSKRILDAHKKISFKDVCDQYQNTARWRNLSVRSKRIYLNGINNLVEFWSDDITKIKRPHVIGFLDRTYDRPGRCREALAVLNNVFQFAYDRGIIEANPAGRIRGLPPTRPIPRWPDTEINKFIETAPEYLSRTLALALYTGQRRSDLVNMEWDDIVDDHIHVIQQKTGKELFIPIHPRLKIMLDGPRKPILPYILWNFHGQKMTCDCLTQGVKRHALRIGLKNHSIHGVRKATASTLAEIGCSVHQIAAITGQSLKEVEHYTRGADQRRMAKEAMEAWV